MKMVKLRVPKDERNHNVNFGCVIEDLQDCERYIAELENELATLKETAAAMEKYIYAIPALCRGEEVPCALHVSQPIKELRDRNAELEQMVRNLLREGSSLLNAAGDKGMRGETAALDWCCTAEDALELLENSHAQT